MRPSRWSQKCEVCAAVVFHHEATGEGGIRDLAGLVHHQAGAGGHVEAVADRPGGTRTP